MATVISVHVGRVRQYSAGGVAKKAWSSAIEKGAVEGMVRVGAEGLEGDQQGDRRHHGGPDKALLAYGVSRYPLWRAELPLRATRAVAGAFGENLAVDGLTEDEVCVGDVWRVGGEVRLQVSEPRQPCSTLARHWDLTEIVGMVERTARAGWYHRVLTTGAIRAGDVMELESRPNPDWTVARAFRVMMERKERRDEARELAGIAGLGESWRRTLAGV